MWRGDESQRFYSFTYVLHALHRTSRRKTVDIVASPADYMQCVSKTQHNFRNEFLICKNKSKYKVIPATGGGGL
jgi:hypothetical protein